MAVKAWLALLSIPPLLLAACNREVAPSEEVKEAADIVVAAVEGESGPPAGGPFAPRDECTDLPGAPAFLAALDRAIARRHREALTALAADDIKLGPPDTPTTDGNAMLARRLARPDGAIWTELAQLRQLGCAANDEGGMTLPWHAEEVIPGGDGAERSPIAIVTGRDVPLYRSPDENAQVIARLSHEAVEMVPEAARSASFVHVRLVDGPADAGVAPEPIGPGPAGYIASDNLRRLDALTLKAASRNGRWRIVGLTEGS